MDWKFLKRTIQQELLSHDLANHAIRLNALESIETMLDKKIKSNPDSLLSIDKEELKSKLSSIKKLNSAESSIINHMYDIINGRKISFKVKKLTGVIKLPEDFDYRKDYAKYLAKKY